MRPIPNPPCSHSGIRRDRHGPSVDLISRAPCVYAVFYNLYLGKTSVLNRTSFWSPSTYLPEIFGGRYNRRINDVYFQSDVYLYILYKKNAGF